MRASRKYDSMRYLNLGCGTRFHPDWINVDITPSSPDVISCDLKRGIPYSGSTFDVVYHSHLLEHLSKQEAPKFIKECYRVLKPHGIIRVVVPDLERIALNYLQALNMALKENKLWGHNYDWMMLELYDQAVREHSGGAMLDYLKQEPLPNEGFVLSRIGYEARQIIRAIKNANREESTRSVKSVKIFQYFLDQLRISRKKIVERILGGDNYEAFRIGRFRQKGEIHQWMYDRFSLARLLKAAGFEQPAQRTAIESSIDNWVSFNLDTEPDGTAYKPDSLFMEAFKPEGEGLN